MVAFVDKRNGMPVTMILGLLVLPAGAVEPLFFDTNNTGPAPADVPAIKP